MKAMCAVLAMVLAMGPALQAQQSGLTKEDVIKMAKAGVGEDIILAKIEQDKATFALTADDLALLKELKVSEKVIQRMLGGAAPAPKAAEAGAKNIQLKNISHRSVKVAVNEKEMLINFSVRSGSDLAVGGGLDLAAKAGDYRIAIEGRPTTEQVRVPAEGSCTMTVRGADTEYIDVQTIVCEDSEGRRVVILHSQGKATETTLRRDTTSSRTVVVVDRFWGPEMSYLPRVSDTVLLGAGIGAIIGHQRGQRTRGAVIGATTGLLIDMMTWR